MRYLILSFLLALLFSCGKKEGGTATGSTSDAPEQSVPNEPAPAPALPANLSVKDLRNEVRNVLRMQLPNTYPEMRNGEMVTKGYSFDIEPYAQTGRPVWIVQEKLYNPETQKIITGGKYYLLWATVDPNSIGYVYSDDNEKIGIVIRPLPRQSFIFHPFAQELQDEVTEEVVIGWYDRVQDATLARGVMAMKTLAANMEKWKDE